MRLYLFVKLKNESSTITLFVGITYSMRVLRIVALSGDTWAASSVRRSSASSTSCKLRENFQDGVRRSSLVRTCAGDNSSETAPLLCTVADSSL